MSLIARLLPLFVLLTAAVAQERPARTSVTPQPRVRLQREANGDAVARRDEKPLASSAEVQVLEKVTVQERRIPFRPPPLPAQDRTHFTVIVGGPVARKNMGNAVGEVGLWRWTDLFDEDSRHKEPNPTIMMEFLRVKW